MTRHPVTLGNSRAGYVLVFERTRTGYSVYAPDVPGCISTGRTLDACARNMEQALKMHLRLTRAQGFRVTRPRSLAELRRRRLLFP